MQVKKSKKSAPPPIKKRKVAIESDDDDEDGEAAASAPAVAEDATQVSSTSPPFPLARFTPAPTGLPRAHLVLLFFSQHLSVAIKVDPSLPDPNALSSTTAKADDSDLSEEDLPLSQVVASSKVASPSPSAVEEKKRKKPSYKEDTSDDDDKPLGTAPSSSKKRGSKKHKSNEAIDDTDEDDKPLPKKLPAIPKKQKSATPSVVGTPSTNEKRESKKKDV